MRNLMRNLLRNLMRNLLLNLMLNLMRNLMRNLLRKMQYIGSFLSAVFVFACVNKTTEADVFYVLCLNKP